MMPTVAGWTLTLVLVAAPAWADSTASRWREDLRVLGDGLRTVHRDPYRRVSRDSLGRAIAELDARIPSLASDEVILGMARIAALLGDGHTRLALPEGHWATDYAHLPTRAPRDSALTFHHLPVRFWAYDDGLGIQAVLPGSEALLGARLLGIDAVPADSLLERIRPLVSCDNDQGLRYIGAARLSCQEALRVAGIASRVDGVTLTLRTREGRTERVALQAVATRSDPPWRTLTARAPVRLADRHPERPWWMAPIEGRNAWFIRLNQVTDTDTMRLAEFADRLARMLERQRPERLILDLRANTGGNGQLLRPLVLALARARSTNSHGGLFVLTGRRTFSAAQLLVNQLEQWTEALFVGEPTGTTPSHFGDSRRIVLPNSGLTLRVSTVYWRDWTGDEARRSTLPDLPVPVRIEDDAAGRDPALEAALAFEPASGLAAQVAQLDAAGGRSAAVRRVMRAMWDTRFARAEIDSAAARLEAPGSGR